MASGSATGYRLALFFFFFSLALQAAPLPDPNTPILWDVPLYSQSTNYSCGAAALQSAFGYYGITMSEQDIMKAAGTTPENGTEMEPMAALAISKGLSATVRTEMEVDELRANVARGQITIATLQAYRDDLAGKTPPPWTTDWDDGHYMIVLGVDGNNIYFEDPSESGTRGYIPMAEFLDRWHDMSVKLGKMQHPAIVLEGKPNPIQKFWNYVP